MSNEERHLQTRISLLEDAILRAENYGEQVKLQRDLAIMRNQLQKMYYQRMSL